MTEHSAFAMGWISGLCMGMGLMKLAWEREMRYQRRRAGPGHEPLPPSTPAPGMRRVYYDMPSTIAECGGPCSFGGPELCDCGALWRDVPTTPKPDIVPTQPTAGGAVTDRDLAAFEHWWYELGSGYHPMPDEEQEEHAHRVARLAWMACARQVIHLQLPPN